MTKVGKIFLVQPDYGAGESLSHRRFWAGGLKKDSPYLGRVFLDSYEASFSAGNIIIATALNAQDAGEDITHIGMLHNDVIPEHGWVDTLMEELLRTEADLMSAVIPIKDLNGLTSTAIDSVGDPYEVERRLTLTEVHRLPETFFAEDCGYPAGSLLVNTGCFIADFTKPYWREENPDGTLKITMTSPDRIARRKDGKWQAEHSPSDWKFSRDLQKFGAKIAATRKLRVVHMGKAPYTNDHAWGHFETDQILAHNFDGKPIMGIHGDTVMSTFLKDPLPAIA